MEAGNIPLIEVTGTYYESYESACWKGPVMIVEDVHYAVEIVKSARLITCEVGPESSICYFDYTATVHNYWERKFTGGEVDDLQCNETSVLQKFPIGEIEPESELSVTWQGKCSSKDESCCDYANVTGNVSISDSGDMTPVLWTSNEVPLKVKPPEPKTAADASTLQTVEEAKIQVVPTANSANTTHVDSIDSLIVNSGCTACRGGQK
jgi:hypothetical protein